MSLLTTPCTMHKCNTKYRDVSFQLSGRLACARQQRSVLVRAEDDSKDKQRSMEDELRDPKYFLEYLLPRPVRLTLFGASGFGCFIALLLGVANLAAEGLQVAREDGSLLNLGINAIGLAVFAGLFVWDQKQAEVRVQQRATLRKAQIKFGDREVYYNEEGEKMSILKEVDDEWIIRRLERWGKKDNMPFLGPQKAGILQDIIRDKQPKLIVEVGGMCGYSALKMSQVLPKGGSIISIERDLLWVLAAKRFLWQSSQGSKNQDLKNQGLQKIGDRVKVKYGDALQVLPELQLPEGYKGIDLLLLDGVPKETLAYLQAAEPLLSEGAVVVADNAGVFKDGGMKNYLEYVRGDSMYSSEFKEGHFEWWEDVPDGMEVSTFSSAPAQASSGDSKALLQDAAVAASDVQSS